MAEWKMENLCDTCQHNIQPADDTFPDCTGIFITNGAMVVSCGKYITTIDNNDMED